jgi:hypothetical protein
MRKKSIPSGKHRVTNGNCKMPCSGILGYAKPQSGYALYAVLLRHILRLLVLLRKPLFATAKRQLPRTLGDIKPEDINIYSMRCIHAAQKNSLEKR